MKRAIALVILFANLAWAQNPTNEQEWRSEIQFNVSIARLPQLCGAALRWVPGVAFFLDFPRSKSASLVVLLSMIVLGTVVTMIGGFWDLASGC
jgi:hypothetical protein